MFAEIIGIHDYPEVIFSLIGANFADVHRSLGALTPFLVPASVYVSRAARPCRWVSTGQTSMHPAGQLGGIPRSRELCRRILPARSGVPPVAPNRLPRAGPFFCNNLQIGLRTRSQGVVPKAESRLGPGGSEASAVAFEDAPFSTNNCGRRHPFGFSFTPAGLLFPYYIGVASCLHDQGLLQDTTPVAGTSAGSIIAVSIASGVSYSTILEANKRLQAELIEHGHLGRVADVLRRFLDEILPDDIHVRATGRVCIGITSLDPYESMEISDWDSKEDLIEAVLASSFVPWWISKDSCMEYRGRLALDGAPTIFLNDGNASKCDRHVRVCAIPSSRLGLSNVVDICPDLQGNTRKYSWAKLSWMALNPCSMEVMDELYMQGYQDAGNWAGMQQDAMEI